MTVNFAGIAGGSRLSQSMGVKKTYASWIGASYAYDNLYTSHPQNSYYRYKVPLLISARLTQGTLVLISGRLGDVYGHRELLLAGGVWLSVTTLASSFCSHTFFAFVIMRALSGLGGAFVMPNAVAMIASTNPPGRIRNLSLGFFAASAPMGGYFGALFLGAFMERTEWKWFFVFM